MLQTLLPRWIIAPHHPLRFFISVNIAAPYTSNLRHTTPSSNGDDQGHSLRLCTRISGIATLIFFLKMGECESEQLDVMQE